ncbi:zf-HC2 domain-containing protein [Paenibacillus sp. FSL R7-0297]|uniref:zf-HC2 domain-containing protein n=1 Tax=Paenibacillus sp. FSL R7-0297 TaxID=2921680 RepID=UPI0030F766A4
MKCAEVMEWMHRYLDHDLSQEEMLEMFRHIDDCPSCAEVFDRLTMLSRQLEELPDVKPPFSLVDSILPQLEQLDRGVREEPVMVGSEDPKIVPFTRQSTRGKKSKGASIATRTGIGAAAAAVILLFAIFNLPESMPGADMDQAYNAAGSEASSKMITGAADNAAPADAGQNNSTDGGAEIFFSEQATAEPNAEEDAPLNSTGPAAGDSADVADNADGADAGPAPAKEPPATQAPSAKRNATAPPAENSRKASSGNNDRAADPAAQSQIFMGMVQEDAAADTAAPEEGAPQDPNAAEPGPIGLLPALVASQPSWSSPDGRYTAELAGQQVVIYSAPAGSAEGGRVALNSLPIEGTWVSGVWSEDSSQFTYVTQLQDGTQATKTYTVPAETSAPVPSVAPSASVSPQSSPVITPDAATSNK